MTTHGKKTVLSTTRFEDVRLVSDIDTTQTDQCLQYARKQQIDTSQLQHLETASGVIWMQEYAVTRCWDGPHVQPMFGSQIPDDAGKPVSLKSCRLVSPDTLHSCGSCCLDSASDVNINTSNREVQFLQSV